MSTAVDLGDHGSDASARRPGAGRRPVPAGAATVSTATPFTGLAALVLGRGARGGPVRLLQRALGGLAVDGVYGLRTEAAVRAFQETQGLKATGIVQESTWVALEAREYPLVQYRSVVLRPGDRGGAVVVLQRALRERPDGWYGGRTEAAVSELQARHHLSCTGVVGPRTWEALESEARQRR